MDNIILNETSDAREMEERGRNNFLIMFCPRCHDETCAYIALKTQIKDNEWPIDIVHIDQIFQFDRILFPTSSPLCVQVRPQESEVVHLLSVKCEMGVMELEAHTRRWPGDLTGLALGSLGWKSSNFPMMDGFC